MTFRRKRPFLVALRWVLRTRRNRRWVAQRLSWVSGQLSRIKTYRRFYTMDSEAFRESGGREVRWSKCERHWSSCGFSHKVLEFAMQLDWVCWDHWALDHTGHETTTCPECGHQMCEYDDDWDDEDNDSP